MDITLLNEFIKPELFVLAVAMYFVGMALKRSSLVKDEFIPLILGGIGILIAGIYVFATTDNITSTQSILLAIFTSITQGILCAAADVYVNQLIKQTVDGMSVKG